jgi:hypothetical protein
VFLFVLSVGGLFGQDASAPGTLWQRLNEDGKKASWRWNRVSP